MSSYTDLLGWIKAGTARPLNWIWGDDRWLVEDAVDKLHRGEIVIVFATARNDAEIWNELNQLPAQDRHVIVRDAHLMRDFRPLPGWRRASALHGGEHRVSVCFVGNEHDFDSPLWSKAKFCPRGHPVERDTSSVPRRRVRCVTCNATRRKLITTGRIVECARPRTEKQRKQALDLIGARAGCASGMAIELLNTCEGSLGEALKALDVMALFGVPEQQALTEALIKRVAVTTSASDDFVSALRRGDRPAAAGLAGEIDPDGIPGVLVRLERWLGLAQRGASAVRSGRNTQELVRLLDVSWGEAELIRRNAGRWSAAGVSRATEALAAADRAFYRDHGRVGVLEGLALSW